MSKKSTLIYVVEDSVPSALLYQSYLKTLGYSVRVFHTGLDALAALNDEVPDILIQDIQLPDINGLDILREVTNAELPTKTIVITSNTEVDYAVEATRSGAFDFIEKPFNKDRLLVTVANALKQSELMDKVQVYSDDIYNNGYADFIGKSVAMQLVYRIIENVGRSKASVFITGESGTGKELCASAIHQASPRSKGPFIAINCAAIPKELFESEIFGHIKGSFSGAVADRQGAAEMADGGTLFLDELCEMDLSLQAKLLRLIQSSTFQKVGENKDKKVDVRFLAATNRNPQVEVDEGRFREDLYYRLNVVPIELPPLRERDHDVMVIAESLLSKFNDELNKSFTGFSPEVAALFLAYAWPGNVRELQNILENTLIMNEGDIVTVEMLPETFITSSNSVDKPKASNKTSKEQNTNSEPGVQDQHEAQPITEQVLAVTASLPSKEMIQPLWLTEKLAIEEAIRLCYDNIPLAATHLDVSASTLYRKIKSWQDAK